MRPPRLIAFALLILLCSCSPPPQERWSEDYAASRVRAAKEHRMLLLLFTGRDWCPACQHLEKTILNHPVFLKTTEKETVRFFADFPHHSVQDSALAQQNITLAKRFRVNVFPTLILLSGDRVAARHEGSFSSPEQFRAFFAAAKAK